jgi:hypothetical protein
MSEHRAWLRQAQKDEESVKRVLDLKDRTTFCHAIAKSQQAVEKSVKALVAALRDCKGFGVAIGWTHPVERFMSFLIRLAHSGGKDRAIQSIIHGLFNEKTRGDVRALDRLAPRRPPTGSLPGVNTEYPFVKNGEWRAPADPDIFSRRDVDRFRALASRIVQGCARIISAIERGTS